jgi:hypothetical protein
MYPRLVEVSADDAHVAAIESTMRKDQMSSAWRAAIVITGVYHFVRNSNRALRRCTNHACVADSR